jgi:hypothetical protein
MDAIKEIKLTEDLETDEILHQLNAKGVKANEDLLKSDDLSEPLKNYLYLSYLPELVEYPKAELDLFYGKYYWLSNFVGKHQKLFGTDEGLEQQLFKLAEEAEQSNLDVDWNLVEEIEAANKDNNNN